MRKYPTLNLISQVLETYDFNKKHKSVNLKPIPLICILRLSKSQLNNNSCKTSIFETAYQLMLEYSANESNKMYFPELYIPCIIHVCKRNMNDNTNSTVLYFYRILKIYSMLIRFSAESILEEMPRSSLL
jgi:hypothetical protein